MYLRALEPKDLDLLYSIENDMSLWATTSTTAHYSHYALKQFIMRSVTHDIYELRQMRWVVMIEAEEVNSSSEMPLLTNADVAVALIDLSDFSPQHLRAEVGLVVLPAFRRLGIGERALRLLEEYCRLTLSLHQLYAYVISDNEASMKLFEKALFSQVGTLRDWFQRDKTYKNAILWQKTL